MRTLLDIFVIWPMPAVWLLVIGVALLRRLVGRILAVFAALLFLIGGLPATGRLLLVPLENGAPLYGAARLNQSGQGIAAIVVFSAGVFVDSASRWWPQKNSILRTVTGLGMLRSTDLPLIVTGGSPVPGQPPEAEVIARFIDLPAGRIVLETSGRDTFESGKAVADLIAHRFPGEPVRYVILVTSPSHVARASAVLRHFDIEPLAAPVASPTALGRTAGWRAVDFVPSARGLTSVRGALREYVGIAWYLISGRIRLRDL